MAKKKKHKNPSEKADAAAPSTSAAVPGAAGDKVAAVGALDRAFLTGNVSAVRRLAAASPGGGSERVLGLVKVDRVQFLIGLGALLFLVVVATLVLRAG